MSYASAPACTTTHKYLVRDHRERHLYMFWPIYPVVSHIFDWKAGLSIFLPQKLKFRERERVRERGREKWKVPTFFQCGGFPAIYCSSRKHGVTISKIWINLCNIRFRLLHAVIRNKTLRLPKSQRTDLECRNEWTESADWDCVSQKIMTRLSLIFKVHFCARCQMLVHFWLSLWVCAKLDGWISLLKKGQHHL